MTSLKCKVIASTAKVCPQKLALPARINVANVCKGCDEWYNVACAGIEADDLPILNKYESVHWKICNTRASQLLPKKFIGAVDNISKKQDADKTARDDDNQPLKEIKKSLQQVIWNINELLGKNGKNHSVCAYYADAVKNCKLIQWKMPQTLQLNVLNVISLKF